MAFCKKQTNKQTKTKSRTKNKQTKKQQNIKIRPTCKRMAFCKYVCMWHRDMLVFEIRHLFTN